MKRLLPALLLAAMLTLASGCATKQAESLDAAAPAVQAEVADSTKPELDLDNYDDFGEKDAALSHDPLEGWNRFWFGFNDGFMQYVLKPAHKGYSSIVPEPLRNGISNSVLAACPCIHGFCASDI